MIDQKKIVDLENQIDLTIFELEKKLSQSSDIYIIETLKKYKHVKSQIEIKKSAIELDELRVLLNRARGYMEISSDYMQDFLNEMGKTEKLIKEDLSNSL